MRQETTLFARAIMREDRSVLDFLDGRFTFVNGPLRPALRHPGRERREQFRRVELDGDAARRRPDARRVLTLSSYATRTSPGDSRQMGAGESAGDATVASSAAGMCRALEEKNIGTDASLRERLEQHRANPACAVCHNQMDPIGFGLENYDASGAWRD